MRSNFKQARREAFKAVGETCPHVDSALAEAATLIKEQTEALRSALIDAIERAIEAEERVCDLEDEVKQLKLELEEALACQS